jgi:hypothetical protein
LFILPLIEQEKGIMNIWRTGHHYLILAAFALKILVFGTLITLATHHIGMHQLLDNDVNWTMLVCKQHKRHEDNSNNSTLNGLAAIRDSDGSTCMRKLLSAPTELFLKHLVPICPHSLSNIYSISIHYLPQKIFIRCCSLRR